LINGRLCCTTTKEFVPIMISSVGCQIKCTSSFDNQRLMF
jgi:hypothetical protein